VFAVTNVVPRAEVKVLFADDDLEILRLLQKSLEKQGYNLHKAHNGAEALELALVERPNVIVLDVMMPELTGWEVCKHLRQNDEFNNTGIIMLTAIGEQLNEMTAPLYGADAHVDKPFDFSDVQQAIEDVLAKRCGIELS
jgi:CheY-like chemotaxis protein